MKYFFVTCFQLWLILQSTEVDATGIFCDNNLTFENKSKSAILNDIRTYCSEQNNVCNRTTLFNPLFDLLLNQTKTGSAGNKYQDRFLKTVERFLRQFDLKAISSNTENNHIVYQLVENLKTYASEEFSGSEVEAQINKTYEQFEHGIIPEHIVDLFIGESTEPLLEKYLMATHVGFEGHPDIQTMLDLFVNLQCSYNKGKNALWQEFLRILMARTNEDILSNKVQFSADAYKNDILNTVRRNCLNQNSLCSNTEILNSFVELFLSQIRIGSEGYKYQDRFVRMNERFLRQFNLNDITSNTKDCCVICQLIKNFATFANKEFLGTEVQTQIQNTYTEFQNRVTHEQIIKLLVGENTESLLETYLTAVHVGFKGHPDLQKTLDLFVDVHCANNEGKTSLWEELKRVIQDPHLKITQICQPNPCLNGGTCVTNQTGNGFTCNCKYPAKNTICQDFEDPCQPNPCLYNGTCRINEMIASFQCDCPFPTGGSTCQDLICGECSRQNDLVIFLYTGKTVTYNEAIKICQDRQMTLHMPKTPAIFNFTQSYMLDLYKNRETLKHAFWIGLNRTSAIAPFKWWDNTLLQGWSGWHATRPVSELCVDMSGTNKYNFSWDDDHCDLYNAAPWMYYPVCEKRYSFFV